MNHLVSSFGIFMILTLIAAFGITMNILTGRKMTISEKISLYGIPGGGSTNPNADEDAAIAALQATDADEDTTVGLVLGALAADTANVASLTKQLADAVAANNPTQVAARLKALQDLNTANATTVANMKAALAAPPAA